MAQYTMSLSVREAIKSLYLAGNSSIEIKEQLQIPQTPRTIQRYIKTLGITRTMSESFKLAISKKRMTYKTNPNKIKRKHLGTRLRYQILERDGFKCVLCGSTASTTRLQVDHIDNNKNNNTPTNLQVLCEHCNMGKHRTSLASM